MVKDSSHYVHLLNVTTPHPLSFTLRHCQSQLTALYSSTQGLTLKTAAKYISLFFPVRTTLLIHKNSQEHFKIDTTHNFSVSI